MKTLPETQYLWSWRIANGYIYETDEEVDWYEEQKWLHNRFIADHFGWMTEKRLKSLFGLIKQPKVKRWLTTEELLERIDLHDVICQYTQPRLVREGECMARCPFHQDARESLGYNRAKGLWTCYAGCGGGTAVHFVMKAENVDYKKAVAILSYCL